MPISTRINSTAAFLLSEANGHLSRDQVVVTVPVGGLVAGTILGQITATGKYVRHDTALANGAQVQAAILLETVQATVSADDVLTVIVREAEVLKSALVYEATPTAPEILAADAALRTRNIIVR